MSRRCPGVHANTKENRCKFEKFEILSVLGQGVFGGSIKGWLEERPAFQITEGVDDDESHAEKNRFKEELKAVMELELHLNVVHINDYCRSSNRFVSILTEYITITVENESFNNLYMYLIHLRKNIESEKWQEILESSELLSFVVQIADGMTFLEKNKIVHGNLMTKNILINDQKKLKISNFDFAKKKQIHDCRKNLSKCISQRWAAPETIYQKMYSNFSDVWSFGVVIWEIGTLGGFPFPDWTCDQFTLKILKSTRDVSSLLLSKVEDIFDTVLNIIMKSCWSELDERPYFYTILNELKPDFQKAKFFKDFDISRRNFRLVSTIEAYKEKNKMQTLWDIEDFPEFISLQTLGEGEFGKVELIYSNTEILGNNTMVLKQVKISSADSEALEMLELEKNKLQKVKQHENLVRILAFKIVKNKISIISEYIALNSGDSVIGNLHTYLLKSRSDFNGAHFVKDQGVVSRVLQFLNHKDLGSFALQIAKGMSYLETNGVSHGTLSAKKILMSYYKTVKISDYGLPFTKIPMIDFTGDFKLWAAPEVLNGDDLSIKSDVWTFGVLLWEMATLGAYPYGSKGRNDQRDSAKNFTPEKPQYATMKFSQTFDRCLKKSPEDRPSFENLVKELQNCDETFNDFKNLPRSYKLPPTKREVQRNPIEEDSYPPSRSEVKVSNQPNYAAKVLSSTLGLKSGATHLPTRKNLNPKPTMRATTSISNIPPSSLPRTARSEEMSKRVILEKKNHARSGEEARENFQPTNVLRVLPPKTCNVCHKNIRKECSCMRKKDVF